ncbi:MAG: hypothetical protein AVDCRST_MAG56-2373 [uncultured Cytophagales bacterium]|uniref:Uncharacterized protein n=1 Tax=uncultured Cytophagales bacterium TaxID=158755 RepID=A0A6J4H4E1_9SPHI|nr:MAG: hypothetical protein AVDCRST_MAG56-2373 [uncultured Cytophagales bacterium]
MHVIYENGQRVAHQVKKMNKKPGGIKKEGKGRAKTNGG